MKLRDIPQSGRDGASVYCHRAGTTYVRVHVEPADPETDHQRRVRDIMGMAGKRFGTWLTETEREAWRAAAELINSRPRLGRSGPLTGSVLFAKLNCPRELIGRDWLRLPSAPVLFGPSPVGELTVRREQGRWRLELAVSEPVTDDIMVFATPPCPATWTKCRKPRFLGLLPTPVNGVCDITSLYLARFGEPEPGRRIFIRTVPQRDGWEGAPLDTNDLVPAEELTPHRRPLTSSFIIPTASFPFGPCPWEIHAVHTVSARSLPAGRQAVRSGLPPPAWRWRGCQPGQTARSSARARLSSSGMPP